MAANASELPFWRPKCTEHETSESSFEFESAMAAENFAVSVPYAALQMATRPYGTFTEQRVVKEVARYRCVIPAAKVNTIVRLAVKSPKLLAAVMVRLHGEQRNLHLVNKARAKGKAKGKAMGKAIAGPKARAKGKAKGKAIAGTKARAKDKVSSS